MLQNDLYTINTLAKEDGAATVVLSLNASHQIFKGHFPGQPVLPGACMLQMVKEIMELVTGSPLQLKKANHLKFISLVDPSKTRILQMDIMHEVDDGIHVNATLLRDGDVCLKFSGVFQVLEKDL
jgi:3-hydroxyacyl-[acyl-carrier-protein] dehydratase